MITLLFVIILGVGGSEVPVARRCREGFDFPSAGGRKYKTGTLPKVSGAMTVATEVRAG